MRAAPVLSIETLVVPGLDALGAERLAAELHGHLAALEDADRARGVLWRQPEHPVDLTLDCGADGRIDAAGMAAAIRTHFIAPERPA
jgi:hypothetical protein